MADDLRVEHVEADPIDGDLIPGVGIGLTSVGQVPMSRLRSIFDGMFDGVWLLSADGRTTYANRAIATLLGTTRAAMRGRPLVDFVDPGLEPDVSGFLSRQRVQPAERMELELRRADGAPVLVMLAGSPIYHDRTYVGAMLNVSDVSGKRSIDAQLMQTQRLEAIGQFAGGIAHDFNNLLTSIHGFAELALATLPDEHPAVGDIGQVLVGTRRATAITRRLLAFTRRQILAPVDVDPAEVVSDLVPMLRPLLGDGIALDLDIDEEHAWVRVDPTQLEQVVVNLALNARDAMPAGGTLSIAIHDLVPTDPTRPDEDLTAGPFVRITVSDTGQGMDEATRGRIFDPFFTTKSAEKGTGLGLSTVFGIVTQSGGQITVASAPDTGATFNIDLPRVDARPDLPMLRVAAPDPRHDAVVLIVDDDGAIREFARRTLEKSGYTVLTAESGTEALEVSATSSNQIDVLLTDIVMPGIRGPELAKILLAHRPQLQVVLMSGYSDDTIQDFDALVRAGQLLPKPFDIRELKEVVSRAVDASVARRGVAAGG